MVLPDLIRESLQRDNPAQANAEHSKRKWKRLNDP